MTVVHDEANRLKALRSYRILDTNPEQDFDDLTLLASEICGTPIALISLVDENRQWFKSRIGLPVTETSRSVSFCAHAIRQQGVFVVEDAMNDARFRDNPLVLGDPHIRFYASAPLLSHDGYGLGTLCVIDRVPRTLSGSQQRALDALRRQVEVLLELQRSVEALRAAAIEREESQRAIDALSARTRLIIDTALDAVITIDREGLVTLWNSQAKAIFGWTREEAVGRTLAELIIPPGMREAYAVGIRRHLATGEARLINRRVEMLARHRDGHDFPVELAITPLRDGEHLSFSAFVRDISLRKKQERLLVMRYEITRALASAADLSAAAPAVLTAGGKVLGWDAGALWLLDSREHLLRCVQTWTGDSVTPAAFLDKMRTMTFRAGVGLPGRVLSTGEPVWIADVSSDANCPRADLAGQAGLRSAIGVPIVVEGRIEGVMEFFHPEAARPEQDVLNTLLSIGSQLGQFILGKRMTEALRESESQLRLLIDNMREGMVLLGPDLHILRTNPAFASMFGYAGALLPGMPIARLLPGIPELNPPDEGLGAPFHPSLGRLAELEGRRSTGETVPVSVQFYEVQAPEGRLIAGHVRDLSQEREVDRLKKRFVASVSHELRTPLTAIRGSLGLLAKGAGGELASEARDLVNMAERNAVRLGVIINDILDFERIESGLLSLAREQFPLDEAVSSMLDAVSGAAGEAGIRILAEPTGLQVYGDRARIEQVLVNLVSNAIKFSPVDTAVEIQATRHATHVEVRVCDRGRGIPPDQRDTIFGMFRQVEDSDARRHGGSGLGLAICRAIVGQHGGAIRVDERDGGGSIFQFTLPARVGTAVSAT